MPAAACLFVAGALAAALPGGGFTLAWTHSVQKTRWEERYVVEGNELVLAQASVEGSGAGMEPPPEARRIGGRWVWEPGTRLPSLTLRRSGYTADYTLCAAGTCRPLDALAGPAGPDATATLAPCPPGAGKPP